jgi:uncharacterized protein (DUF488 family)
MAKKPTLPLFTIGYEQAKSASVLKELKAAKVELLVDVRAVAASRRPGFSKRQLAAGLDTNTASAICICAASARRRKAASPPTAATSPRSGASTRNT